MKTITINIENNEATIVANDTIDRNDFKILLRELVDKYGNQPGIKRTLSEKKLAREELGKIV